jgi:hypothetical protein
MVARIPNELLELQGGQYQSLLLGCGRELRLGQRDLLHGTSVKHPVCESRTSIGGGYRKGGGAEGSGCTGKFSWGSCFPLKLKLEDP